MNRRAIGIFIAATIAVMIIASTNVSIIIQQRQAYAASPTPSSLNDNLRANLGNRNQHLNQQGNCIRTDECARKSGQCPINPQCPQLSCLLLHYKSMYALSHHLEFLQLSQGNHHTREEAHG
jgi:hypothetical protein